VLAAIPLSGDHHDVLAAAPDPNRLLSSLAQSAAALVAIIGGFLVSRLVSLSIDRARLIGQRKAAYGQLAIHETFFAEAHQERLTVSEDFLSPIILTT
jgi:hypothetical protein